MFSLRSVCIFILKLGNRQLCQELYLFRNKIFFIHSSTEIHLLACVHSRALGSLKINIPFTSDLILVYRENPIFFLTETKSGLLLNWEASFFSFK